MIIKHLISIKSEIILKLEEFNDNNFVLECKHNDSSGNQKITINSLSCNNLEEATLQLDDIVKTYIAKGYQETPSIKVNALIKKDVEGFFSQLIKKFKN